MQLATYAQPTFTLVVYEQRPESCELYLIPNDIIDTEAAQTLECLHGKLVNHHELSDAEEIAASRLNAAFCEKAEYLDAAHPTGTRWAMCWVRYKMPSDKPITGFAVTRVVRTGWVL